MLKTSVRPAWLELYFSLRKHMLPGLDDPAWQPVETEQAFDTLRFVKQDGRVFTARRVTTLDGIIEWHDWAYVVSPTHFMEIRTNEPQRPTPG